MAGRSRWGLTPRQSIEGECARRGTDAVVAGCVRLIEGKDVDRELILALGGPPARWILDEAPVRAAASRAVARLTQAGA